MTMRVTITSTQLRNPFASQLVAICKSVIADSVIERDELKHLRRWLREHAAHGNDVPAIAYLLEVIIQATSDNVVDRDELLGIYDAIERVLPKAEREKATAARKKFEFVRRAERAKEREELRRASDARRDRISHVFSKVVGVTHVNRDGVNRQAVVAACSEGEGLILNHEPDNLYSEFAVAVLRVNGQQVGYLGEHLAEDVVERLEAGYRAFAFATEITGGNNSKFLGMNIAVVVCKSDCQSDEVREYVAQIEY